MRMALKDGKRKVVTLSYDDAPIYDKRLMGICDKNGLKCTFNINSGKYGDDTFTMSRESCINLYKDSGHEVAIHGLTHPFFDKLTPTEIIYEVTEDRRNLERDYGMAIRGCAYPFGRYNDSIISTLRDCGIVYSRTINSTGNFAFPDEWLALNPTCHHDDPDLMEMAEKFVAINPTFGRCFMFYLWGHSYEFNNNNNWEVIEKFAEYVGGRDDIWYATNIEIYDYIQAFKNLHVSFDNSVVYNPSVLDVWVTEGENTYHIKPGQTIFIEK